MQKNQLIEKVKLIKCWQRHNFKKIRIMRKAESKNHPTDLFNANEHAKNKTCADILLNDLSGIKGIKKIAENDAITNDEKVAYIMHHNKYLKSVVTNSGANFKEYYAQLKKQ